MMLPLWAQAGGWGLLSGSALLLGAFVGYAAPLPQRLIAAVMAFGAGVLISALAFELMDKAVQRGGFAATAAGFLGGAVIYTAANLYLIWRGAHHRKHSHGKQASEAEHAGSGLALALGALLDGIPESIVIGVSLIEGGAVSVVAVVAVFLSNLPEGLSSAAGMKKAGRSTLYIFSLWGGIALISGLASMLGYLLFSHFPDSVIAATTAVAAGAILTMLVDTMIPEAFEQSHAFAGLITVVGFLCAFALSKLGG